MLKTKQTKIEPLANLLSLLNVRPEDSPALVRAKMFDAYSEGVTKYWLTKFLTQDPQMEQLKIITSDLALNNEVSDQPVLITGPTGTGKELIAKALHGTRGTMTPAAIPDMSKFIAFNCAALTETLLDSELFGHTRGSFTGASDDRKGLLQAAENGTVFLDEIAELPPAAQVKLLRALQEKEVRPVGSNKTYPINCRVIAASKDDLYQRVQNHRFREDLYARLMTFELYTTPLKDRPNDIRLILDSLSVPADVQIPESYLPVIYQFNVRALQTFATRWKVWRSVSYTDV